MWMFQSFFMASLAWSSFADQNQYTVYQENMTVDYVDNKVGEVFTGVVKISDTESVLNMTITLKIEVPEDAKISVAALKWIKNDYRLRLIQISKTVKSALDMEMFDLQGLFVDHFRPPLTWPLKKGVTYRGEGWNPDSSKYPPNLPAGRWKVPITVMFGNNTKIAVVSWYLQTVYKK